MIYIYLPLLLSLSLSTCSTRDNRIKQIKKSKGIINKTCTYIKKITPILIGYEMLRRGVTPVYSQAYSSEYETTQWP